MHGTWERPLCCLRHIARATFALKYQDILVTRGPGGNGKDVLANRVATMLGTYFVNLACEALTSCRDLDSPSQTILGLRSKRFVCVREMAKKPDDPRAYLQDHLGSQEQVQSTWPVRQRSRIPSTLLALRVHQRPLGLGRQRRWFPTAHADLGYALQLRRRARCA